MKNEHRQFSPNPGVPMNVSKPMHVLVYTLTGSKRQLWKGRMSQIPRVEDYIRLPAPNSEFDYKVLQVTFEPAIHSIHIRVMQA